MAQSSGSTTRPSLFVDNSDDGSDDDDDACVEIMLVTPIRFVVVIPSSGNQGESSAAPAAKGPSTRADRDHPPDLLLHLGMSEDAIHTNFLPFSASPYYATNPEVGVAGNCEFTREEWDALYQPTFGVLTKKVFKDPAVYKTVVDQFPTPVEMVRIESLSNDQLTTKMSVLHCMMMSHGGELLARYRGLNQSHHEYVLSADPRLKGYEEKVASLTGLELQVSTLKKQVSGLNEKLSFSDASFAKSKAKGKERKKKIKSLTKSMDNLHAEVARLSADLNRVTILEAEKDEEILHLKATPLGELLSLAASVGFERELSMHRTKDKFATMLKKMAHFMPVCVEPLSVILQLEPEKLVRPANVPTSRDAHVSPPIAKESTVTPAFESFKLSANVVPAPFTIALEQNEEWGTSYVLDDFAEVTAVGSGRVSSSLTDVVVALSTSEKGNGSLPSSTANEEATANPSGV
ncbi:hypothetical protein Tco_0692418 [Tanacetum coccineum]